MQIDLFMELCPSRDGTRVTVGDIQKAIANIWSSGLDGVSVPSFNVDSFFDIEYRIDFDEKSARTVQTEILSMSLTSGVSDPSDPGAILAMIDKGLSLLSMGDITTGHVTVLK